jgi:hypothetical protein
MSRELWFVKSGSCRRYPSRRPSRRAASLAIFHFRSAEVTNFSQDLTDYGGSPGMQSRRMASRVGWEDVAAADFLQIGPQVAFGAVVANSQGSDVVGAQLIGQPKIGNLFAMRELGPGPAREMVQTFEQLPGEHAIGFCAGEQEEDIEEQGGDGVVVAGSGSLPVDVFNLSSPMLAYYGLLRLRSRRLPPYRTSRLVRQIEPGIAPDSSAPLSPLYL